MATELRHQVDVTMHKLDDARAAGLPYEVYLHRRRLQELLDAAQRRGVPVESWVDRAALPPLALVDG